jgi:acid phosphatase type 7
MRLPVGVRALAVLLAIACDKVREIPGVQARSTLTVTAPVVTAGPWLLDPGPSQMTVAWVSATPSIGKVWYGTGTSESQAGELTEATVEHRLTLRELRPSTQYKYKVEGGTDSSWFTTAPEPGAEGPFDVLIYGDNRSNNGDHALVARAAAAERAPLALHTGDMVVNARDDELWRIWFDEEHDLLAHSPLVPTVGNHEITDTGVAYSKYFQHRNQPAYWSLDYGPLHLVVLDSFEVAAGATPHSSGVSDSQRAWFLEDVKKVPKDRSIWVLVHQGPYSHPEKVRPSHGGSEPVLEAVQAARKLHRIAAVFAGHEHFYQRGETDGLKWFVLGGGGAPLEDPDPAFPGVAAALRSLSYAIVHVCGCHATGQVKDIAGHVIDSFKLSDCATPCGAPLAAAAPALPQLAAPAVTLIPKESAAGVGASDGGSRRRSRRREDVDGGAPDGGTP